MSKSGFPFRWFRSLLIWTLTVDSIDSLAGPPDIFQKLDAGEDLVGICEEFVQEKELFQGKCKYIAAAADGHCIIVKRGRADRESVIGSNTGAP